MDMIKKIFPFSFKKLKTPGDLAINILIQIAVGALAGILIGVLSGVPILNWIAGTACGLVDLYVVIGIVLSILNYLKVLK